ncbi:hypothetical protein [Providencia huaxiensis]
MTLRKKVLSLILSASFAASAFAGADVNADTVFNNKAFMNVSTPLA